MNKSRYDNITETMNPRKLAILLIEKDFENHMIYKCPDGICFNIHLVEDKDEYEKAIEHTISWLKEKELRKWQI